MKAQYSQIVQLILGGADPVSAVAQVYEINRTAAHKRLYLILRHREVFGALKASPVASATHPRRLMRGVFVGALDPARPSAVPDTADALTSVRDRLRALLYQAAVFTPGRWADLATDIKATGFLGEWAKDSSHSDYFLLCHAFAAQEQADNRRSIAAKHPEYLIPREWMNRIDIQTEQWFAEHPGRTVRCKC